jgi:hypothetical protein
VFAASPATPDQALPAPWAQRDVGPVGGSGATGFNAATGTFNVIAGGQDITDASDAFHFTYQPLVGDGEITARLAAQEPTDGWAKAGVMVRESLSSGSRHAMMVISPDHGATFQWRPSTGGGSKKVNVEGAYAPYWVRLVRRGSTLTGYRSADGVTWTEQGSATIDMAQSVFIGLAAVPGDNARLAAVAFDNVSVSNFRPTIAIPASASESTVAGRTVRLWALGADDHGESNLRYDWAAVRSPKGAPAPQFSDGGTNVAKNVTATFFRAGAYLLRVRVTDASGLAVVSTVTVQVAATPTALRVAPADGSVRASAKRRFTADVLDQFGQPVAPAPAVTWYATAGSVDADGVYTAPRAAGRYLVGAEFGSLSAYVAVTVVDPSRRTPPRSAYVVP